MDAHLAAPHHELYGSIYDDREISFVPGKGAGVANKSAFAALPKSRVKKTRMSKLEAERLAKFKAMMA